MKRLLCILLVAVIALSFDSCINDINKDNPDIEETKTDTDGTFTDEQTNNTIETDTELSSEYSANGEEPEPNQFPNYNFSSPKDLLNALNNGSRGSEIRDHYDDVPQMYYSMLERFQRGEITLKYPVIDGYEKDFLINDVVLFPDELFDMPWIWYRKWYDNKILVVQITYLDDVLLEYSKTHSAWDVGRYVKPTMSSREELEKNTYVEEKIMITEFGEISVMYQRQSDYPRAYLLFIADGMMVRIFGSPEDVDFDLINKLHFIDIE